MSRLRVALHGMVLGFPVPFHLTNDDACQGSGLACPLAAGKQHSFVSVVPIKMVISTFLLYCRVVLSTVQQKLKTRNSSRELQYFRQYKL